MNKAELIEQVHQRANGGPDHFYETTFDKPSAYCGVGWTLALICEALERGEDVKLPGLGTFRVVERKARTYGRKVEGYPVYGWDLGAVTVPAHLTVKFVPDKSLRRMPLVDAVEHADGKKANLLARAKGKSDGS